MFAAAIVAFFLKRHGFSPAGLVLGLVLGEIGECSFAKSMQLMQYDWLGFFSRPIAATLIVLAVLTATASIVKALRRDFGQVNSDR